MNLHYTSAGPGNRESANKTIKLFGKHQKNAQERPIGQTTLVYSRLSALFLEDNFNLACHGAKRLAARMPYIPRLGVQFLLFGPRVVARAYRARSAIKSTGRLGAFAHWFWLLWNRMQCVRPRPVCLWLPARTHARRFFCVTGMKWFNGALARSPPAMNNVAAAESWIYIMYLDRREGQWHALSSPRRALVPFVLIDLLIWVMVGDLCNFVPWNRSFSNISRVRLKTRSSDWYAGTPGEFRNDPNGLFLMLKSRLHLFSRCYLLIKIFLRRLDKHRK